MMAAKWREGPTVEVEVEGGATTPATLVGEGGRVGLVWGHGLGVRDPASRTRWPWQAPTGLQVHGQSQ